MRIRRWLAIALAVPFATATSISQAQVDKSAAAGPVEGLVKVRSRNFDEVYLRPGTDFRGYPKVTVEATHVAFAQRWLRDVNEHRIAVLQGTTGAEANQIAEAVRSGLQQSFARAFERAGYEVVRAPGESVLGLSLRLTDLYMHAPSTVTNALPSRIYAQRAGEATLILELRDSATGALLGRIVDHRATMTRGTGLESSVRTAGPITSATNRMDFGSMFGLWALYCLDELKAWPPVATGAPKAMP